MMMKYIEAPLTEYLHQKASKQLLPLSGTFELTPVCNMSCRMCYVRMTREEQEAIRPLWTAEEWILQVTSYMFPPLRRDASMIGRNERFSPEEAAAYSAKIECLSNGRERFLEHVANDSMEGLAADQDSDCQEIEGEGIHCRAGKCKVMFSSSFCVRSIHCRTGKCSFWVTWDGRFLPCGMLPGKEAADVFAVGFDEAWRRATEEAAAIRLPGKCTNCSYKEYCRPCAASVLTETGTYGCAPEYRCRMAQAYPEAVRKLAAKLNE